MTISILRAIPVHAEQRFHRETKLGQRVSALQYIDEDRLLSGSEDHTLVVWDLRRDARIHQLTADMHDAKCVAISPDRSRALSGHGSWGAVKLWDLAAGTLVADLAGSTMYIGAVGFASDGRALAVKGAAAWVWSGDGTVVKEPKDAHGKSTPVALSPDGAYAARMTPKGVVLVSFPSLKKKQELGTVPGDYAGADRGVICFSPDGSLVAAGDRAGNVRVWNLGGELVRSIDGNGEGESIEAIAVDRDQLVFATSEGRVSRHADGTVETIKVGSLGIEALAIAPGRTQAAIGTADGHVKILGWA